MMEPERWQEIERLYHLALEREESSRAEFLEQACGQDEALRREVESLLAYEKPAQTFMEAPSLGWRRDGCGVQGPGHPAGPLRGAEVPRPCRGGACPAPGISTFGTVEAAVVYQGTASEVAEKV